MATSQRSERLGLALDRIRRALPDLDHRIECARVQRGDPADVLVAAARIEAALPMPEAEAQAELALLFLVAGDHARATCHAEAAAAPGFGDAEVEARARAVLGRLAESVGRPAEALVHYRAAAALMPASWRHQLDLADALITAGALEDAADTLSIATALAGDNHSVATVRERLDAAREEYR